MVALAVALLVGASSASAALSARSVCGASCGTLEASNASGALTMAANGDVWGRVGKGVILLLDRSNPGSRDWSVTGARGTRVSGTNWWRYSGRNLSFSAYHKWTIKIRKSSGVYLTAVAAGWVRLPLHGTFTRNGVHIRGGARYSLHS
jgi:hypothetical protein